MSDKSEFYTSFDRDITLKERSLTVQGRT